jgi:hypothetical protein
MQQQDKKIGLWDKLYAMAATWQRNKAFLQVSGVSGALFVTLLRMPLGAEGGKGDYRHADLPVIQYNRCPG